MADKTQEVVAFKSDIGLADYLNKNYINQIKNFFSDEKKALKFLSSVRADVQRNPRLLECTPQSIVNSYMIMAQFGFMPSSVSGEAYVLPYNNSKSDGKGGWLKVMEAQFQLGYQGLVTLFYQAGVEKITAELVRKNDKFSYVNGELMHEIDLTMSNDERGERVGAYVKIMFRGNESVKFMNIKDILAHGEKFSKSFDIAGKYSPWNPENDPEGWMLKKTVLKQGAKLMPKNETINKAIDLDNQDSRISEVREMVAENNLAMGNFLKENDNKKAESAEDKKDGVDGAGDSIS